MTDSSASENPSLKALDLLQSFPCQIERMHRRFLDVVRLELTRHGIRDISPVQIMMMTNIGREEISVRDLIERGYYLGSNASYNLKQLVECGYVDRQAAPRDKRSAFLKLSAKGRDTLDKLAEWERLWSESLVQQPADIADVEATARLLRRLERRWSESIRYRKDSPLPPEES